MKGLNNWFINYRDSRDPRPVVLILAKRLSNQGYSIDDQEWEAELVVNCTLKKALKNESLIKTKIMEGDDTIIDCMVYRHRQWTMDTLPSGLLNVPNWYAPWLYGDDEEL